MARMRELLTQIMECSGHLVLTSEACMSCIHPHSCLVMDQPIVGVVDFKKNGDGDRITKSRTKARMEAGFELAARGGTNGQIEFVPPRATGHQSPSAASANSRLSSSSSVRMAMTVSRRGSSSAISESRS